MRYLSLSEVLELYQRMMAQSGGKAEVRDIGLLESCLAQPKMTFGNEDLYPSLSDKAAALCHGLIANHPFVDGNKRIGQAATETFLVLNSYEISATTEAQEDIIISVASGRITRDVLKAWFREKIVPLQDKR